jgi:hypothetical protein
MFRGFVSVCALVLATPILAADRPSAADAIAQKFAGPPPTSTPKPLRPAHVQAAKPQVADAQPARAERPTIDYEMDMLRRARAELASEKAAAQPVAATASPAATPSATEAPAAPAPVAAVSAPPAVAVVSATPSPAASPTAVAPTFAAAPSLPVAVVITVSPPTPAPTPPPAKIAENTPAPLKPDVQATVEPKPVEPSQTLVTAIMPAQHATLLLALETSGASSKSGSTSAFDPMVCLGDSCFVSAGLNADAVKLTKLDALKLKSTSDASPDSCKGKVGCVFRNVAVPQGAQIQVIELGSATHDPLHASDAKLDTTCKMSDNGLNCDNPILTADFKIWLVPEETARTAGVQELEDTLADGLPHVDVARATDK